MKRKIVLIVIAIILLSVPFQSTYHQVDAAVASKAATLTAKKIVKEVIQEAAVNQAVNLAVLEAMEIADKYQAKAGYKIVCPGGGSTCDKPVQVKENLTDADKTAIKSQAGIELDKLITPDGKGFSRWQSFLDWFLPIWAVTFAMSALTYAIDSDFRNLLNEAGYNALVSLGIITPIETLETQPLKDVPEPVKQADGTYQNEKNEPVKDTVFMNQYPIGSEWWGSGYYANGMYQNLLISVDFDVTEQDSAIEYFTLGRGNGSITEFGITNNVLFTGGHYYWAANPEVTIYLNGEHYLTRVPQANTNGYILSGTEIESLIDKKIKSIRFRTPYESGGFWYTDTLYNTVSGDVIEVQMRTTTAREPSQMSQFYMTGNSVNATRPVDVTARIFDNFVPEKKILIPNYGDNITEINKIAKTPYESDDGERIALVPPTAIPYKQESTGETVYRTPTPTGDGAQFEKPDGTIIPEEDIVPDDPPEVVKDPEGVPTVTPAPTPTNPAPEPVPLTPGQIVTEPTPDGNAPPGTTPPSTEEPPLEPFPEGEKCLEKLKFPIFSPLKEQLQTSFPFSIPWDIERAAQAAFGGISDEKPSFEMSIPIYKGTNFDFNITTPKFMDDWKPFTDSLLLITFDILIMFGLYRFVKGAGS